MNNTVLLRQLNSSAKRSLFLSGAQLFSKAQTAQLHVASCQLAKKAKDSNAPKRPGSAYMLWVKDVRSKFASEHPNTTPQELIKLLGSQWRDLPSSQKASYNERYNTAMESYQAAKAEYQATLPPKRPAGPFVLFCKDARQQINRDYPDLGAIEVTQKLAQKWQSLSEYEKQAYGQQYKTNLSEWQSKYGNKTQ